VERNIILHTKTYSNEKIVKTSYFFVFFFFKSLVF
jgi:hypothetical protein